MPRMPQPIDPDLQSVQRAQGGDFAAFEGLVARYERHIYSLAARIVRQRRTRKRSCSRPFSA